MGLNQFTKEPCGFCFVEFFSREHAAAALNAITDSICDERPIRCDLDGGFLPGRQYGRGKSGGQRRDDFRRDFDQGRGGVLVQEAIPFSRRNRSDGDRSRRDRRDEDPFGRDVERPRRSTDILENGLSVPRSSSSSSSSAAASTEL
jgi:nuclear cap-binding protein subunit 2